MKRLKSLVLVSQQGDGGPLGVLVGYLADVLVATNSHWREGLYQVPIAAVLPKLLPGELTALVGAPTNDTASKRDDYRADKQLKRLKNLVLGALVGYLADIILAAFGHWRERFHQVPVAQLERPIDFMVGCLGVRKLLSLLSRLKRRSPTAPSNVIPMPSRYMEMTQLPMLHMGIGDCVHC